ELPRTIRLSDPELYNAFRNLGLPEVAEDVTAFQQALARVDTAMAESIYFNLARIAGSGYYEGMCYAMYGANNNGLVLTLADGGCTDWAKKCTGNKRALS